MPGLTKTYHSIVSFEKDGWEGTALSTLAQKRTVTTPGTLYSENFSGSLYWSRAGLVNPHALQKVNPRVLLSMKERCRPISPTAQESVAESTKRLEKLLVDTDNKEDPAISLILHRPLDWMVGATNST
jgi:hypothetical protein